MKPELQIPAAIIGAGGIGSHFCALLSWAQVRDQLLFDRSDVTVFDFDIIDEDNLLHQDYSRSQLNVPKAFVMSSRYGFQACVARFGDDPSMFDQYNMFIICADNRKIRKQIFEYCKTRKNKSFIDMRCEGRAYSVMTDELDKDVLLKSLGVDEKSRNDATGVSCQIPRDKEVGQVQLGHLNAAVCGMQLLLARARGEEHPAKKVSTVI